VEDRLAIGCFFIELTKKEILKKNKKNTLAIAM
jgi:hypothetical protein